GLTPAPAEFLAGFESALSGPAVPDLATRLRGSTVALSEMESAGSVSDFDEEPSDIGFDDPDVSPISRRLSAHELEQRRPAQASLPWPVLAAAAAVVLGLAAWWMMSGGEKTQPIAATETESKETPAALPEEPPPAKLEPAQPEPTTTAVASAPAPTKEKEASQQQPEPPAAPAAVNPDQPPAPIVVPNPVIIRKAILPSPEEVAKFKKQGSLSPASGPQPVQASPEKINLPTIKPEEAHQTGAVPRMKMASPLEQASNP
ncbi:MAG: hypothetical protein LDL31_00345, partial [Prosthecobacter sp.]|nr:hypothetical protein [Prosthecobacter sp.]